MKKRMGFKGCLSILVIVCLFVVAPSSFAAKTLKIGIVDCYTGPASTYTNDVRDAFKSWRINNLPKFSDNMTILHSLFSWLYLGISR
jgi:hypothetical protein